MSDKKMAPPPSGRQQALRSTCGAARASHRITPYATVIRTSSIRASKTLVWMSLSRRSHITNAPVVAARPSAGRAGMHNSTKRGAHRPVLKRRVLAILLIPIIAVAATKAPQSGRQIVEQGSVGGAPACASCHGPLLQGNQAIKAPALAGRPADYIIARLDHYASPQGHNAAMKQVATALSPSERAVVAHYIATFAK